MLKVNNVVKSYKDFKLDCCLEIQPGCITGLIGKNGAGKTTLYKAILNLIQLDSGDITIQGNDYQVFDKNKIGVVLSNMYFGEYLKVSKIIEVLANTFDNFETDKMLTRCKQHNLPLDKKLKDYSTGMKAKFNILITLSHHASFLLLDEPTAGLDVLAREEILDLIREYMNEDENRSVLISSHISSDLESLCDDIYLIDNGKIVLHEDSSSLLDDYALLKLTDDQYRNIDHDYIIKTRKESYGYACLTNQKQFFVENYPEIILEKNTFDTLFSMIIRGE